MLKPLCSSKQPADFFCIRWTAQRRSETKGALSLTGEIAPRSATALFLVFVFFALFYQVAYAQPKPKPSHVLIDAAKPHLTIFISVPSDLPAERMQALQAEVSKTFSMRLMTWKDFHANPNKHVLENVKRNDYKDVDWTTEFAALLERLQGTPLSVTWNGGIAFTGNDERHATRTYDRFQEDPKSIARNPDRSRDPVHPGNHTEPLSMYLRHTESAPKQ